MNYHDLLAVATTSVAFLFLYSGVAKLVSLSSFVQSLLLIPYFPHRISRPVSLAIPLVEILAAMFLIRGELWAKLLTIAMLITFSIVAAIALAHKQRIACNCFGADGTEQLSLSTICRNLVLAVITIVSLVTPYQHSPLLTESHALMVFLLYLIISKSIHNHHAYLDALNPRTS